MSHPEIIFIQTDNNLFPIPQRCGMLSKLILNKNPKKGRSTTGDSDSLNGTR
ncbi:hypothetical protein SRABI112_01023 [Pseudomonas mediterranea]|uniref:Uncharacterized protein n=1 Tax=Pseudomonas mediterranea TaxID=183795 RepID=A0AAX2DJB4_9PSED|nr:hypothetical protein SRABI112_01023 [Pseudomonas mediterranea]SDU75724.1 hypothetical protein SAMN05216476_5495 [Pseudomonas mediterranea]